jgi:opacity protein-like surface antigen
MRLKLYYMSTLAVLICAACSTLEQTVPAAATNGVPLAVGAGFSGYNPDFGHGHLLGGTLWIDYTLPRMPHYLNGIGVEVEARDLNYGRSATQPANLRLDVAGGGVIYSWPRFRSFRPYAKFFAGFGNADDAMNGTARYHDSRNITMTGGGMDFRAYRSIWVRADYEYQWWPDMVFCSVGGSYAPCGSKNPQGFTVGAMYHFNHPHHH